MFLLDILTQHAPWSRDLDVYFIPINEFPDAVMPCSPSAPPSRHKQVHVWHRLPRNSCLKLLSSQTKNSCPLELEIMRVDCTWCPRLSTPIWIFRQHYFLPYFPLKVEWISLTFWWYVRNMVICSKSFGWIANTLVISNTDDSTTI